MTLKRVNPAQHLPNYWYIVFTDHSDRINLPNRIIRWFTSPGFRHCFLLKSAELGCIALDPYWHGISVSWSPLSAERIARDCLDKGHKVLFLEQNKVREYYLRGFITCVSVIKMMIGIKNWRVITPRQLYDVLLSSGAHLVKRQTSGD